MVGKRVLVVDNDVKSLELVKLHLKRDGHKVFTAHEGGKVLPLARKSHPDLIVLDFRLLGIDGLQTWRRLRAESEVPIMILTTTTDRSKLASLNLGADNYLTKPFTPKDLAARVRAVLRRLPEKRSPVEINVDGLRVNFHQHEASLAGKPLSLTPIEFKLLVVFIKEPGQVFNRGQLIQKAIGHDYQGFDRTIDVHILNLRRKINVASNQSIRIKTVYGVGYKLVTDAAGKLS
jgi:two-component system alkaline phosphatase synthesis response regulator PhoP